MIDDDLEKLQINISCATFIKKSSHIRKFGFPSSITMDRIGTPMKADPSTKLTWLGIRID
jgi:hypothetical protein